MSTLRRWQRRALIALALWLGPVMLVPECSTLYFACRLMPELLRLETVQALLDSCEGCDCT